MNSLDDTIVAVSTPPGRSARGMVRLAGPGVMAILGQLLTPPDSTVAQLQAWPTPRRLIPCRIQLPAATRNKEAAGHHMLALPVLLALFTSPRSYTGQTTAEIQCPGHPALLNRLVHHIVNLGATMAEPGQFTHRAFLSGKLDLTQAEGIAATIAATSDSQLRAAAALRRGELGQWAGGLVNELANLLALVEAGIDFVDQEDVVPITPGALRVRVIKLMDRLEQLRSRSRSWGVIEALPRVVLVGAPSTGKSTLFNALLNRNRAIVSHTPGTTRDVLAEPLTLEDRHGRQVEVLLIDMAGLDAPTSALDRDTQAATAHTIEQADLLLEIHDKQTHSRPHHHAVSRSSAPSIRVRTKADLIQSTPDTAGAPWAIAVSAHCGEGLVPLRAMIQQRIGDRAVAVSGQALALQPRHEQALQLAMQSLREADQLLAPQCHAQAMDQVELVATALRMALNALAGLGGRMTPDDVIGRVFARFCVGK